MGSKNDWLDYLEHTQKKGATWKEHKYIKKVGNLYYYGKGLAANTISKAAQAAKNAGEHFSSEASKVKDKATETAKTTAAKAKTAVKSALDKTDVDEKVASAAKTAVNKTKEAYKVAADKAKDAANYVKPQSYNNDHEWDNNGDEDGYTSRKGKGIWSPALADINEKAKLGDKLYKNIKIGNKKISGGMAEDGSIELNVYTNKNKKSLTEQAKDKVSSTAKKAQDVAASVAKTAGASVDKAKATATGVYKTAKEKAKDTIDSVPRIADVNGEKYIGNKQTIDSVKKAADKRYHDELEVNANNRLDEYAKEYFGPSIESLTKRMNEAKAKGDRKTYEEKKKTLKEFQSALDRELNYSKKDNSKIGDDIDLQDQVLNDAKLSNKVKSATKGVRKAVNNAKSDINNAVSNAKQEVKDAVNAPINLAKNKIKSAQQQGKLPGKADFDQIKGSVSSLSKNLTNDVANAVGSVKDKIKEKAVSNLEKQVENTKPEIERLLALSDSYFEKGDVNKASQLIQQALNKYIPLAKKTVSYGLADKDEYDEVINQINEQIVEFAKKGINVKTIKHSDTIYLGGNDMNYGFWAPTNNGRNDYLDYLEHSGKKGMTWKKHKYVSIENGNYIYRNADPTAKAKEAAGRAIDAGYNAYQTTKKAVTSAAKATKKAVYSPLEEQMRAEQEEERLRQEGKTAMKNAAKSAAQKAANTLSTTAKSAAGTASSAAKNATSAAKSFGQIAREQQAKAEAENERIAAASKQAVKTGIKNYVKSGINEQMRAEQESEAIKKAGQEAIKKQISDTSKELANLAKEGVENAKVETKKSLIKSLKKLLAELED